MATVANIITNARYDLRDHGAQKYDDAQLVLYTNRIIKLLDDLLITQHSDLTFNTATTTLNTGAATATVPTGAHIITKVYNGTVLLIKKSPMDILDRYHFNNENGSTGTPSYWALLGDNINVNIEADADYTLGVHYHKRTATLILTDDLPYSDLFNEFILEAIIVMAQKAKDDKIVKVDMQFYEMFRNIVASTVVSRNHIKKPYNLGF